MCKELCPPHNSEKSKQQSGQSLAAQNHSSKCPPTNTSSRSLYRDRMCCFVLFCSEVWHKFYKSPILWSSEKDVISFCFDCIVLMSPNLDTSPMHLARSLALNFLKMTQTQISPSFASLKRWSPVFNTNWHKFAIFWAMWHTGLMIDRKLFGWETDFLNPSHLQPVHRTLLST